MEKAYYDVNQLYTQDTIGIKTSELEKIEDSASNLSKGINIDINALYDKPFWFKYNGKYYYYKEMKNALRVLNELLGQYFSEYMDLESIRYDLALSDDGIVGVLSENFRKPGIKYIEATELPLYYYMYIDYILHFKSGEDIELKRKINALLVKDIFTSMIDRHANTLCMITDHLELAPQFDFEYSLSHLNFCGRIRTFTDYTNPLFRRFPYFNGKSRAFEDKYLKVLCQRDKDALKDVEKMSEVDMGSVLEEISDERKLYIPEEIKKRYESFYNERKKTLRKIID